MTACGSQRADVVIVGAGIIGCACAHYLSRRGLQVVILEREGVAAGASGACDGHLTIQTKQTGLHLELALESRELYDALPPDFAHRTRWRTCGSLLVAQSPTEVEALEALTADRQAAGVPVRMVTGSRARQLEPSLAPTVCAAAHCPTDAQANPWRITQWFADASCQAGAQIVTGQAVSGIEVAPGAVTVVTAGGVWEARVAVVACGAWTPGLCAALDDLPIRPRRGEVLVTERLPRLLNGLVISASYLARKHGAGSGNGAALAIEQTARGNVLVGGTREFVGYRTDASPQGLGELAAGVGRLLPPLEQANLIRVFAGLRPHVAGGLPIIGPLPDQPSVVVATGHEGDGIMLAPVTGRLVAQLICDGQPPDPRLGVPAAMARDPRAERRANRTSREVQA